MVRCEKCGRKLKRIFHYNSSDELAVESLDNEIIIGNCCENPNNYYCEYCDEFFQID